METQTNLPEEPKALLSQLNQMITPDREDGNSWYIKGRKFPTGDVELMAMKLHSDDALRKGGGSARKNTEKKAMDEVTLKKSQSRARTRVRHLLLSMQADRMLTLTFKENVTDINEGWACFKYFIKLMRERYEGFKYVAVPEYQKRGAVHFHTAISGYHSARVVRAIWRRAVGLRGGNIDITSPKVDDKNSWNPKRIANYLSKYITKNESVEFNRRRYSAGGDIEIPPAETGWMGFGLVMPYELSKTAASWTNKDIVYLSEIESYFEICYLST